MICRLVGNDVVDLKLPANQASAADDRFHRRVLATDEYAVVAAAPDPARALWMHWAAKESAYKALRRGNVDPRFLHRKFHVTVKEYDQPEDTCARAWGVVQHDHRCVVVAWQWSADWLHCTVIDGLELSSCDVRLTDELLGDARVAQVDETDKLLPEAVAARVLALQLLEARGVCNARIQRGRRPDGRARAPQVILADGSDSDVLLSLSHDGRFAAAALSQAKPRPSS